MSQEEQEEQELQEGQADSQPEESQQESSKRTPLQSTQTSFVAPASGETYEAGENQLDP